jgi:hypothetical protein
MPELYRGITLNQYLDDEPEPNRPGQRENTNFKAILDAMATDSMNPDDITLPQGKIALHATGNTTFFLFQSVALVDVAVPIVSGIIPVSPGMTVAGIEAIFQLQVTYDYGQVNNICYGSTYFCSIPGEETISVSLDFTPGCSTFVPYDPGSGMDEFGIYFSALYGTVGSPLSLLFINRTPYATDAVLHGSITYRLSEVAS